MSVRSITRDPMILSGRWRLAGTTLPIAEIRRDFEGAGLAPDAYRFAGISREEVNAILAFAFPAIREPAVELLPAAIIVHCACGEQTEHANGGWPETELDCVCGRSWSVRLTVEPTEAPAELALIGCA